MSKDVFLFAGLFLAYVAVAVGLKATAARVMDWARSQARTAFGKPYFGRHIGLPALVAETVATVATVTQFPVDAPAPTPSVWRRDEHVGATEEYADEVAEMAKPGDPLQDWLEDIKTEAWLTRQYRQFADEHVSIFDAEVEPATEQMRAVVDDVISAFMTRHQITWDQVDAYTTDVAATEIIEALGGDIHLLASEVAYDAFQAAVSTPTGEYPVIARKEEVAV